MKIYQFQILFFLIFRILFQIFSDTSSYNSFVVQSKVIIPGFSTLFGVNREIETNKIETYAITYDLLDYYFENDSTQAYIDLLASS